MNCIHDGSITGGTSPTVVHRTPEASATEVPVNAVVSLDFDEPLDAFTVTNNSFRVRDNTTNQEVPGIRSVSADGQSLSFVPDAPLAVNRWYRVDVTGTVTDVVGNRVTQTTAFFTTAFEADTTAPQLVAVHPADGVTAVPTNARVQLVFDEAIQESSLAQVTLRAGGSAVPVVRGLTDANRQVTVTPVLPLAPQTLYSIEVGAVEDRAGNVLAGPLSTTFVTGDGVDLIHPQVVGTDPVANAVGVPTNVVGQVVFSERVNPLTVTASTLRFRNSSTNQVVAATVMVAADGLSATVTPTAALQGNTSYRLDVSGNIQDLGGQWSEFEDHLLYDGSLKHFFAKAKR